MRFSLLKFFFPAAGFVFMFLLACESPREERPVSDASAALERIDRLEADFSSLIQEHPNHPEYKPKARFLAEEYRMFADRYPDHAQAAEMLFRAANMQADALGRSGIAVGLFRQVVERWPDAEQAPRAQFLIGYTYHHNMSNKEEALKAYEEFIARYPESELRPAVEDELAFMESGANIEDLIREL